MAYSRGDVVLVPYPFSDFSMMKVRPAVVVSSALYHTTERDLILAAITSNLRAATGPLDYVLTDWQAAGLRYPSALKPLLITTIPARVIYQLGVLSAPDLTVIEERLRRVLGL